MGISKHFPKYYSLTFEELYIGNIIHKELHSLFTQSGLSTVEDLFTEYISIDEFLLMTDVIGVKYDNIELDLNNLLDILTTNPPLLYIQTKESFTHSRWNNELKNKTMILSLTFKELVKKKYISKGLYKKLVTRSNLKSVGDYYTKYSSPQEFKNDVYGVGIIYMSELSKLLDDMYKNPYKFIEARKEKDWQDYEYLLNDKYIYNLTQIAKSLKFSVLHSRKIIDHTLYYRLLNDIRVTSLGEFIEQFSSTQNLKKTNKFIGPTTIQKLDILLNNIGTILIVNKYTGLY